MTANIKLMLSENQFQKIIDTNSRKSINTFAKKLMVSVYSLGRIVHGDFRYKLYVICRGRFMSKEKG